MQLLLRILAVPETTRVLALDPIVAAACDLADVVFVLDSSTEVFRRIVALSRDTPGMWLNPVVQFSRREIAGSAWLQLEARGKIVGETPREYEHNETVLKRCPLFSARPGTQIRLPENLALSKIKLKPNEIGAVTDWLPEWVVPNCVTEVFRAAGLRCWKTKPLVNVRDQSFIPGFAQLFTDAILPPAIFDDTTRNLGPAGGGTWKELGCLTYKAEDLARLTADFLRTAEDWSPFQVPIWVISRAVRECFERNKLRGWAFRPVLEAGSPLQQEYTNIWENLFRLIGPFPNIHF